MINEKENVRDRGPPTQNVALCGAAGTSDGWKDVVNVAFPAPGEL